MRWIRFKAWLASVSKKTWIYVGCIAGFVAIAVICLLVWMHLSGYTVAEWMARYYMWIILIGIALILAVLAFIFSKMRRRY